MRATPENTAAVILAGGFGTRIRHLHPDLPKPMIPVRGRPFVEWLVRYLAGEGITRIVLATGYRGEVVAGHFCEGTVESATVRCVVEPHPLGTAGAFLNAVAAEGEGHSHWLVMNGDSMVANSLDPLFASLDDPEASGAVLGVAVPDAARYGTLEVGPDDELLGFREKQGGAGLINAGVYLFPAAVVAEFPKRIPLSFEMDVFPWLTGRNARLKVCRCVGPFLDIGTPESLARAGAFIDEHAASWCGT